MAEKNYRTTELVEYFLRTDPNSRNDDKLLTYKVFSEICRINGEGFYVPFSLWEQLPAFASIQKCRQKIQNKEGRYRPNEETQLMREDHENEYHGWYLNY